MGNNTSTKSTLSQDNDVSKRKKAGIDRKHFRVIDAERSESLTPAAATANPNSLDDTSEPVLIPNQISVEALNKCRHQRDESNLLSPRHLHMIALAGAIGTGLFLSLGGAIQTGGPLGALLGYGLIGLVVCAIVHALGEVSALFPVTGAFVRHAELLIDPAMGFAIGWNVVYGNMLSIPGEIAAILVLIQYWTDKYPFEIITALIILTFIIGLIGVGVYGDVEYLMAIIKIALVIGIIIMGLVIDLGGIPGQDATGFQSWKDPGPFVEFLVSGTWGKFLGFWAVLNNAVYSFAGVESISIAAAETKSPRQNIPKACRRVFVRVAFFYMTTVFVIGLLVPSNDPDLGGYSGTSTQSPFVIVASRAGIKFVPAVINAVVLASAWSSSNQSILSGTRVISGLAREGRAPIVFSWTTPWGSPFVGVLLQTAVATLSYLCLSDGALKVFYYFLDLTAAATLVNWIMILICHIRMRQALVRQGISRNELPWHHMWTPFVSWIALVCCILFLLTGGFTVFVRNNWDTGTFISAYIDIPLVISLYVGYKMTNVTDIPALESIPIVEALQEMRNKPEEPVAYPSGWDRYNPFWA